MVTRTALFSGEIEELMTFIHEYRSRLDEKLVTVLTTLVEMLTTYKTAVRQLDLAKLHGYMNGKAEEFLDMLKDQRNGDIHVEKNMTYIYHYGSVLIHFRNYPLLYPLMLAISANYRNLIHFLVKRLQKNGHNTLNDFFNAWIDLQKICVVDIKKPDIKFLKEMTGFDVSTPRQLRKIKHVEMKQRFRRLGMLRVIMTEYSINFPATGLTPVMNLATSKTVIPEHLRNWIEYEYHPSRIREHQVFRLFLIPEKQKTWLAELDETGLSGTLDHYKVTYNWNTLEQTSKFTWKWKIDLDDPGSGDTGNRSGFDLIKPAARKNVTSGLWRFLEQVHRLSTVNIDEISSLTGISTNSLYTYRQKALNEQLILPAFLTNHIGLDNDYMICFENNQKNEQLIALFESLPMIKVMKSSRFYRYILYLPGEPIKQLKKLLVAKEANGEIELLWKGGIEFNSRMIRKGVKLDQVDGFM
ncbi:MAG: hypothetical protein ACFFD4_12880 [Candidatus Odinarchaeota archaeon]